MIYDTVATYSWLCIGSFGIGIGTFRVALTFKSFAKSKARPA